ncbi:hypothetical protein DQ04_02691070 [Trypanosoma grayi]|uniref:hypothetical protein n=1 Tax=Trypanosoma grayi TaxID=71804 RepID=UPI0004F41A8C|nr:hypothetical protein DQ04_02691070 [Trypanosoma grayi]KEG11374.1 hypothetical protein DQ04_02691070 [Trypanosoma grayi]
MRECVEHSKWRSIATTASGIISGRHRRRSLRRQTALCIFLICSIVAITAVLLVSHAFDGNDNEHAVNGMRDTAAHEVGERRRGGAAALTPPVRRRPTGDTQGTGQPSCPGFREESSPAAYFCANGAANRAPLFSLREQPLLAPGEVGGKALAVGNAPPVCYSSRGDPVASPVWARGLLHSLTTGGAYEAALSLLRQDPWYMLIGWVPGKFLPPQKPGRKANGDIMFPQTRGSNASYYLETYRSVWHTEFEVKNMRFHFQLVHRNAIAVCVRERIHLHKYYCLPDAGVSPIPIHVCACRHCVVPTETTDLSQLVSMQKRFPDIKEPALIEKATTVHFLPSSINAATVASSPSERENCIGALEAPWLINTSVVAAFPYEEKYNDLDSMLASQADANGIVTMVVFNSFWRDHLHNFVYSFTRKAKMLNLIVATLDDKALLLCLSFRLPCLNASKFAEQEDTVASQRQGFTRKVTEELSWVKPRLAIAVLRRGYAFVLADLDMTWNLSPMRRLLEGRFDIVHQCDSKSALSINSGFYMARPNQRTLRYFIDMMSFRTDESADQNAMRLFMKYDHVHGVSHQCLPPWEFNMKCNYKVERSVAVVNGHETFRWKRYPLNEAPKWIMMHATCLSGARDKIRYFKTIKAWFLEELDEMTGSPSSPKPFCVILPAAVKNSAGGGGDVVYNVFGTTPHSDLYDEMAPDSTYLQDRH